MSSVTRFLRQIPVSTTYYTCPSGTVFYEFVPASTNYVGNYPPGYVQTNSNITFNTSTAILRDMGKTIKAVVGASGTTMGFYRQVQILTPVVSPTTFGVMGSPNTPSGYAPYFTAYLPVTVAGVGLTASGLVPIAGGQM